jgi:hypothetical protein
MVCNNELHTKGWIRQKNGFDVDETKADVYYKHNLQETVRLLAKIYVNYSSGEVDNWKHEIWKLLQDIPLLDHFKEPPTGRQLNFWFLEEVPEYLQCSILWETVSHLSTVTKVEREISREDDYEENFLEFVKDYCNNINNELCSRRCISGNKISDITIKYSIKSYMDELRPAKDKHAEYEYPGDRGKPEKGFLRRAHELQREERQKKRGWTKDKQLSSNFSPNIDIRRLKYRKHLYVLVKYLARIYANSSNEGVWVWERTVYDILHDIPEIKATNEKPEVKLLNEWFLSEVPRRLQGEILQEIKNSRLPLTDAEKQESKKSDYKGKFLDFVEAYFAWLNELLSNSECKISEQMVKNWIDNYLVNTLKRELWSL